MNRISRTTLSISLAIITLLSVIPLLSHSSAQSGASVRNGFGPPTEFGASQCRGACGADCPDSCSKNVSYECLDSVKLRRVETYACGTHSGCREHDDCLDTCIQGSKQSGDCQSACDARAMEKYGFESSTSWLTGGGPYDGKISFEYTRHAPSALEAAYRCPDGTKQQCASNIGCVSADGVWIEPVFDSYPAGADTAMRITKFRTGPLCGESICKQSANIGITGADSCTGGSCTRFGMEFDYENADPTAPLECSTSTSGGDSDFIGDLLKLGADAMTSRGGGEASGDGASKEEDGMGQLLGMFGKILASADSPEDLDVSFVPFDKNGKPIESQRVSSQPHDTPAPIPRSIDLPTKNGHLFVPMYQLANGSNLERKIRCTHKGEPVLETTFVLYSAGS